MRAGATVRRGKRACETPGKRETRLRAVPLITYLDQAIGDRHTGRSDRAKMNLITYNPQPDTRDTIAEYQRVL